MNYKYKVTVDIFNNKYKVIVDILNYKYKDIRFIAVKQRATGKLNGFATVYCTTYILKLWLHMAI